jgi:hypothetical protein
LEEDEADHYSGSVPSASEEEKDEQEDDSEEESDEAEKTFKTITEAAEGDEESMLVGDKSMVALMSTKSERKSDQKYEKDLIDLRAKFEDILKSQPIENEEKKIDTEITCLR